MNAEQRQTAVILWTNPMDLSHMPVCSHLARKRIHHRHLLLYSPKDDTHFTIPRRVEG